MKSLQCIHCRDTGWVCESHLDKPWEGDGACGCGAAGCNCSCNPDGDYVLDAVYASVEPDKVKRWIQ